ncbi:MAG TPA: N-acetyltransferase [Candidatus Marinimicrobia bacterium]|nr:N-acetyltransferase [Candidatus Neomarinimicrobiota bacterium]
MVGGVYWKKTEEKTAYIEKIVIRYPYRKKHLSLKLLEELFNRLRDQRYKYVTIGFFQAGLFYKLGFQINRKFGGLVKEL